MEIQEAIKNILNGEAVLFIGAGFSMGAKNLRDKNLMSSSALADHFAKLSDIPIGVDLEYASALFSTIKGIDDLILEIQEEFTVTEICNYHQEVAKLPWKQIYTTNYDNVFEHAARAVKKRMTSVTLSDRVNNISKDHTICVHLNGFIEKLDRQTINKEFKLTNSNDVISAFMDSEWSIYMRQQIGIASSVFFIGYSLYDFDIRKLLLQIEDSKKKLFFFIGQKPSPAIEYLVGTYGSVYAKSTEDFISLTKEVEKNHIPPDQDLMRPISVVEFEITSPSKTTDKDFFNLFLWGQRRSSFIAESILTGKHYYLERSDIRKVFDQIKNGFKIFTICSDLGNGKSLFLEGLRIRAKEKGFRVFDVSYSSDNVNKELEKIATLDGKVIVLIEEYHRHLKEIRMFLTNANDNAILILTARNASHDVTSDSLFKITAETEVSEIDINILSATEVDWVIDTFNFYGIWGEHAKKSRDKKKSFIIDECKSQFSAILLKHLYSNNISKKLSLITTNIREKKHNYEPLLCIFILTLLEYIPTVELLSDIWGPEIITSTNFKNDPAIKELININSFEISVRSPAVAAHILKNFSDGGSIISVLIKMVKCIEKGVNFNPLYHSLFIDLVKFGSIQLLLPDLAKRHAVINYYETIKSLSSCTTSPLFWLQYAMASMSMKEYSRAEFYFSNAYLYSKYINWDTFQIDNHFARFKMSRSIHENMDISVAFDNFRSAWQIINQQMRDRRLHHTFSVAADFQDFINKYSSVLTKINIEYIKSTSIRILVHIQRLPNWRRNNKHVIRCHRSMHYVIDYCSELLSSDK